jgi:hypothetical protein
MTFNTCAENLRTYEIWSSGLENKEYGCGDPLRWPRDTLYLQKLALTSPTTGGRSVGIVRLRAKVTEFVCLFFLYEIWSYHGGEILRCDATLFDW